MFKRITVRYNSYYDSVTLMSLTQEIQKLPGLREALVGMATDLNKESLKGMGFYTPEVEKAAATDLLIALGAESEEALYEAEELIEEKLSPRGRSRAAGQAEIYNSLEEAVLEGAGIAAISVPGVYAAREARKALEHGLHVFLFSDNVSLEEEVMVKKLAQEKGLLVMGPDCGTAVVGGLGLGFANKVRPGHLGIVAASGTGLQQVLAVIDRLGEGITHAIGTGGRDLRQEVGGITTLLALEMLEQDDNTKVKIVISKPPAPEVREKVVRALEEGTKPAVVCFMGEMGGEDRGKVKFAGSLEEAGVLACSIVSGKEGSLYYQEKDIEELARELTGGRPVRGYLRGLYCGGTLCDETLTFLAHKGIPVHSNVAWEPELLLKSPEESRGHSCLDLGDDYFTRGRPHPMLEPGLRVPRYLKEAQDEEVAILLFDVVLGFGCHPDPAGVTAEAVREAARIARQAGRQLIQIAVLVGTEGDPQGLREQEKVLREAGATVLYSNYAAAQLVARLIQGSLSG
ncbi:MAG: acyl-CoA synthetase FdrA [Thermoanaerobacteraceae bacterium]|nr:acyl-CoA synthetase FdrA [Thermoanaerobacteraceae bacterium]